MALSAPPGACLHPIETDVVAPAVRGVRQGNVHSQLAAGTREAVGELLGLFTLLGGGGRGLLLPPPLPGLLLSRTHSASRPDNQLQSAWR